VAGMLASGDLKIIVRALLSEILLQKKNSECILGGKEFCIRY
jgi:hypothetical protein